MSLEFDPSRQKRGRARIAYSISEWAELVGLSKATVYRMMADGRLRFVQIGDVRRIPAEENTRLGLVSET
jgi:excisionase family DNA binding protein